MAIILDGNSGGHVRNNLSYMIRLRHLIRSGVVTNRIFFSADIFPSCVRNMFWGGGKQLIKVPQPDYQHAYSMQWPYEFCLFVRGKISKVTPRAGRQLLFLSFRGKSLVFSFCMGSHQKNDFLMARPHYFWIVLELQKKVLLVAGPLQKGTFSRLP